MSSYTGRHAEFYDIFYADKPYTDEADFVHKCLQEFSVGPTHTLLEMACGTGTHALELENLGYQILATDYSQDMLACARRKAEEVSSSVEFRMQDMRSLSIPEKPFDAVICLFDSIGYVETNEAITQVLQGVRNHLTENGLFIFEFWHATAMLKGYEPVRVRRWSSPDGELIRISETTLGYKTQTASVTYSIYDLKKDGSYHCFTETMKNRYFQIQEMATFLSFCGFNPIKWFNGFSKDEDINEHTWHVLVVARKK